MINCIFYSLFFALFLNMSVGSLKYSQVHRTFMSTYRGMFEACAVTIDRNGEPSFPYYDWYEMQSYLNNYFDQSLSIYVKDYSFSFNFVNENEEICDVYCTKVQVHLTASINPFYSYDKTQTFSIVDGDSL